jgi:hypothetical protein
LGILIVTKPTIALLFVTALSLSIGWGIRGNFGHEYGAMIPGALAAMAAVLLAGREDWWRRIAYFAFFGALGWSFGGSISYMQVIGYTHSGDARSVAYGFACLFVIGFLWAAMGGAGTALPACLAREQLTGFFIPLSAVFGAWGLQDLAIGWFHATDPAFRHTDPLYWYDTDWLGVLVAMAAVVLTALARRRLDSASSLILHMAAGWWIGFLLLVVALGWRMTPPRGDNWAGCVGLVIGLWVYLVRRGLHPVLIASLVCGFIGGFGFATATLFKLIEIKTGWQTNWHSVLEQTYGFINGLGVAAAVLFLRHRAPRVEESPLIRRWTGIYAVLFVLVGITYLNLRKNPEAWVKANAMPALLFGWSPNAWFNLAYLALVGLLLAALIVHQRRPLPVIPTSEAGKAQLLYLVFLWWMVAGNFERAVVGFAPQRLVTEGVIHLNAVICCLLVLLWTPSPLAAPIPAAPPSLGLLRRVLAVGLLGTVLSIAADWVIVRAVWGNQFAGHAALHIRFGPNATATKEKPAANKPHP